MTRHFALLTAVAGICAAVAVAAWLHDGRNALRGERHRQSPALMASGAVANRDLEPPEVYTDPGAAVATILELRSEFGSVLSNSELDVPASDPSGTDPAGGPQSFDDFVRAAAGVPAPEAGGTIDAGLADLDGGRPAADGELAQSLRKTARQLDQQARRAGESGEIARQQRYLALATLLRAEADALAKDQADDRWDDPIE